jgi:hypothetical protein
MFLPRATENLSGYQNTKSHRPRFTHSSESANPEVALFCRQPALHLGGDARPSGFPERIASPQSQRHLERFRDHFRRLRIPIMALRRLGGCWFGRGSQSCRFPRISESATCKCCAIVKERIDAFLTPPSTAVQGHNESRTKRQEDLQGLTNTFAELVPSLPQRLENLHQFGVDEFIAADHVSRLERVVIAGDA